MRILLALIIILFLVNEGNLVAQVPQKVSYQAVVRDNNNLLLKDAQIGIRISIIQRQINGEPVYVETHSVNSNSNGLISLEVGTGFAETGIFKNISWANGPYFLQSEVDPAGGFSYSITGAQEILSVPYALHAVTADSIAGLQNMIDFSLQQKTVVAISEQDVINWNNKAEPITGNEPVFEEWDKNSLDDFNGNYNDLTNKPENLSQFANDLNFISTETDPTFSSSVASGITSADVQRWNTPELESDPVFKTWDKSTGITISKSQITDLSFGEFEKELSENEINIDVGFTILPSSAVFINGIAIPASQWTGAGTQILKLKIGIKLFDKLKVEK